MIDERWQEKGAKTKTASGGLFRVTHYQLMTIPASLIQYTTHNTKVPKVISMNIDIIRSTIPKMNNIIEKGYRLSCAQRCKKRTVCSTAEQQRERLVCSGAEAP